MSGEPVTFDVLIQPPSDDAIPTPESIAGLRPDPEIMERCRRWLYAQGITAHSIGFGFACSMPRERFETLFRTRLEPTEPAPGMPPLAFSREPTVPEEAAGFIGGITLNAEPVFF